MSITFLHTSHTHIQRFNDIVHKIIPDYVVNHIVNETLLEDAIKAGEVNKAGFAEQIKAITADTTDKIICTCSTYGVLCDDYQHVFRIDGPIAELIVTKYKSVGIAYTAVSTRDSSMNLIADTGKRLNQSILVKEIDCSHCWTYFEQGDIEKYESEIALKIRTDYDGEEVIFLSQASMQGAKRSPLIADLNIVSSAEYGVAYLMETLSDRDAE